MLTLLCKNLPVSLDFSGWSTGQHVQKITHCNWNSFDWWLTSYWFLTGWYYVVDRLIITLCKITATCSQLCFNYYLFFVKNTSKSSNFVDAQKLSNFHFTFFCNLLYNHFLLKSPSQSYMNNCKLHTEHFLCFVSCCEQLYNCLVA